MLIKIQAEDTFTGGSSSSSSDHNDTKVSRANPIDEIVDKSASGGGGSCSVLIFVSPSPDSVCACQILTQLLRAESVVYKIKPVAGFEHLTEARQSILNDDEVKSVVMINCGAIVDLEEFFFGHIELDAEGQPTAKRQDPDQDQNQPLHLNMPDIYVFDSHRPIQLHNTRPHNTRVKVVVDSEEPDDYPSSDEDSEPEEEDQPDDGEGNADEDADIDVVRNNNNNSNNGGELDSPPQLGRKRARPDSRDNESLHPPARRQRTGIDSERASRIRQRRTMIEEYYRCSRYGTPASVIMYQLAILCRMDSNHLLWLSIVGLTDHFIHEHVDLQEYVSSVHKHSEWVRKFQDLSQSNNNNNSSSSSSNSSSSNNNNNNGGGSNNANGDDDTMVQISDNGTISFEEEFRFMCLRHWNLYDSIMYSRFVAARIVVWREPGRRLINTLLAKMGIPLTECKEQYSVMSLELKQQLKEKLQEHAPKYNLEDVVIGSFVRQHGPRLQVSASDTAYALAALLEEPAKEDDKSDDAWERNFWNAYSSISLNQAESLLQGIRLAIRLQKSVVELGTSLIEKREITASGPFRYAVLMDPPPEFTQPLALSKFAVYMADAYRFAMRKPSKPFVVAASLKAKGTVLVVGVPDLAYVVTPNNPFGLAFRQSAEQTGARFRHDSFETAVMEIQKDDLSRFMEVLHSGLIQI